MLTTFNANAPAVAMESAEDHSDRAEPYLAAANCLKGYVPGGRAGSLGL